MTGTPRAPASSAPVLAGGLGSGSQRYGKYDVRGHLGAGTSADLFAAVDTESGRPVALKILQVPPDTSPRRRMRMIREAQALGRINHPNLLRVLEVGAGTDHLFLAMELVHGSTLDRWLAAKRRDWREVINLFLQAAEGLAAAHAQGLTHRELRPSCVLVTKEGRAIVSDFGLARILRSGSPLTDPGAVVGAPAYLSPEQHQGRSPDARSDQFSWCVALFEALFGAHPFRLLPDGNPNNLPLDSALALEVVQGRLKAPPARTAVPDSIRAILLRGLAVDPQTRFRSMRPLVDALRSETERARRGPTKLIFAGIASSILALSTGTVLGAAAGGGTPGGVGPAYVGPLRVARERTDAAIAGAKAGKVEEAQRLFEQAVGIYERIPGAEVELARALTNHGRLLAARASKEAAINSFERAAELIENKLGPQSPERAGVLHDLAILSMSERGTTEALQLHENVLAIRESALGPIAPELVDSLRAIGWLERERGAMDRAIGAYRKALAIREQRFGAGSVQAARGHDDLGWVLLASGALEEADRQFEQASQIAEQLKASGSPELAPVLRGRGTIALLERRPADAVRYFDRAVHLLEQRSVRSLELARARFGLAAALHAAGRDEGRALAMAESARAAYVNEGLGASPQAVVIDLWLEAASVSP